MTILITSIYRHTFYMGPSGSPHVTQSNHTVYVVVHARAQGALPRGGTVYRLYCTVYPT